MPLSSVKRGTAAAAQAAAAPSKRPAKSPRPAKEAPLPSGQLAILCAVLLTESICSSVLFPFVPSFIAHIKGWKVDSSGYASGFPIGLFMFGQVVSGKMWGKFSDVFGRKLAITFGVLGCAVCMFFFGLSGSIWVMCFWRFMHGMLAGCSIVAKTMINDLTDATNRAKGLALVSLTWGIGTLIGPAIGGYLYDPASNSTLAFLHISATGFLSRNPAFLPGAVVAMYNLVAVVISAMYLRESNKGARRLREVLPPSVVKILDPVLKFVQPRLPCDDVVVEVTGVCANCRDEANVTALEKAPHATALPRDSGPHAPHASFGFKQAFQNPLLRRVCIISMLICTADMMFMEALPLWLAADTEHGGLQLSPSHMAILVLMNGVPSVFANIAFPKVLQFSGGPIRLWVFSQTTYALSTAVVPTATSFGTEGSFWFTLVTSMLRRVVECWTFALIMVMVSLTAPQGEVGTMFGIQQSTASLVRCIVPFIFAPLFAWSIAKPRPFPFDHYLVFLLSVIPLAISAYIAAHIYVPSDSDNIADEEDQEKSSDVGDRTNSERRSGRDSGQGSLPSRSSFFSSVHGDVRERGSLLNSFANVANSSATNTIHGMVHSAILTFPMGSPLHMDDEEGTGATHLQRDGVGDSRDNSSQQGDEADEDDEYASFADEMALLTPVVPDGILEHEDIRFAQRSALFEDEELPGKAMHSA
ncbi:hypothetical protein LSCM1_01035 [Leishmania martiniquensis]|uniref:Major facilitator superfamily (MFS) profile domain-containing protein n=1 Tax=Leishmania martiniquensis TaxID=1580590 RepID=A0A836GYY8_9TRYP|nr:hypothetical protein LSCM1_01035 [Leishmania martiniquensis]